MQYIKLTNGHTVERPRVFRIKGDNIQLYSPYSKRWMTNSITHIKKKLDALILNNNAQYITEAEAYKLTKD
jgi:hypothetical protein